MENDLTRFVVAQQEHYSIALNELRNGQKRSHWMWYIFPQIAGLGYSETARYFAISGPEEARAYFCHELLGERLRECVGTVLDIEGRDVHEIFGSPDDLKFQSSMTLFEYACSGETLFASALERYYDGNRDERTLQIIQKEIY